MLVPKIGELAGGSLRENRIDILKNNIEQINQSAQLQWYLELREFGGSPTGGFGIGLERLLQYMLNIPNIKDCIAFPRWPHNCQL